MKEKLNKFLSTFSEFWKAQSKKRKYIYISVLAGVVLIAIVSTILLNRTQYVVLYNGLESDEASKVMTEIDNLGIDANLSSNGEITVPEEQESSLRMQLATLGYPKNTLNYDVWNDNVDMFTTDAEKREQSRMQLQENLMDTIETLQGVDEAIVTLSIPEQKNTVIIVNAQPSTASVVLHLKDGVVLSDKQITGIRHIVITAVSGLTEENVTITDGSGKLLVEEDESNDDITIENEKLIFKQKFQQTIKEAVLEQLIPAYGEDGVSVVVYADLNYDQKVSENTTYKPSHDDGSGMVQNQEKSNASGTDGISGGVVGAETNADDTYPTETEGEGSAYSQNDESTNYLVNTLKEQIEKEGYEIENKSVSVLVYKELLSDDEKETLISNVAAAAGVGRDFVSIGNLPKFGESDSELAANADFPFGWSRQQFFIFMAILLVLIIIFMVMYILVSKSAKKKRRAIEYKMLLAAQQAGEAGKVDGFFNAAGEEEVPSLTEAAAVESKEAAVRREIGEFAQNSPEIVAQLLKSWLREEDDDNNGRRGNTSGRGGRNSRR